MKRLTPKEGNKTFCMAPWRHSYLSPQSERRMCCASTEPAQNFTQYIDTAKGTNEYKPMSLQEHWNSDAMKSVRRRMLAGEELNECNVCNNKLLNTKVYRDYFNHMFKKDIGKAYANTTDDGETNLPVVSFDYRFSNLCNFKCRMCGSMLSSQWEVEDRKHNVGMVEANPWMQAPIKKQIQNFTKNVAEKEFSDAIENKVIEEIYWVGGEPLMYEEHWKYMQRLVEIDHAKNVQVRYNTNLSRVKYKNIDLFKDLLINFKNWRVCASIDGTGKIGEWIRTGLDWNKWVENFEYGLSFADHKRNPHQLEIDFTLTTPGLFEIENMFNLSLKYDAYLMTKICFAFSPDIVLCPLVLPKDVLHNYIDAMLDRIIPRATWKQETLIETLQHLKTRKTFAEQWPDTYRSEFEKGKARQLKLESIRQQNITIDEIFSSNHQIYQWWTRQD